MRYAIVSDVHANWQAWNAVLLDIRSQRVDRILCLGDCVGYGPDPARVLESIHENVDGIVLGNHDAALVGKLDSACFNEAARESLAWTRPRLNSAALRFLADRPLVLDGGAFLCAHADFAAPGEYHYLERADDARPSWAAVPAPLLFAGHTHIPALFVLGGSGVPRTAPPGDFVVDAGRRFVVNVGSVGDPRDGDVRAAYCIYDEAEAAVYWRRVPFDLDAFRAAILAQGLDPAARTFLARDPRANVPPLRAQIGFSPPAAGRGVHDAVAVREVRTLQRRLVRWRRAFWCFATLAAFGAAVVGAAAWRHIHRGVALAAASTPVIQAQAMPLGQNLLAPLPVTQAPTDGWALTLDNRTGQRLQKNADGGIAVWSEDAGAAWILRATPVAVTAGLRMCMEALVRGVPEGVGDSVTLSVALTRATAAGGAARVEAFAVAHPLLRRQAGWRKAQKTFETPPDTRAVELIVQGQGRGTIELREVRLFRR